MSTLLAVLKKRFDVGWFAVTEEALHVQVMGLALSPDVLPEDGVMARLYIANNVVGKRSVTVNALVYRPVCTKGLILLMKRKSLFYRHHGLCSLHNSR